MITVETIAVEAIASLGGCQLMIAVETITVEVIAVETITVEAIAVETIAVEAITVETIMMHHG